MFVDFLNLMQYSYTKLTNNNLISGKNGSGASETKHWQDMITKPRQTIVQWHRLKPE